MNNKNQVVYENDMFTVEIASPIMSTNENDDLKVYAVINKETGVRETETSVLLQARMEADCWKVKNEQWRGEAEYDEQFIQPAGGFNPQVVN